MWIVAAYASTIAQIPHNMLRRLVAIARTACERATPDQTQAYFSLYLLIDDLRRGRDEAFVARMRRDMHLITRHGSLPVATHPIVRYANGVKHRHPISMTDWGVRQPRSINWRILDLISDIQRLFGKTARTLPLFERMLAAPPHSNAIRAIRIEMDAHGQLEEIPWLEPPWDRLVRARG
jgi:hypothetical protein